jgi:hypothetical protein
MLRQKSASHSDGPLIFLKLSRALSSISFIFSASIRDTITGPVKKRDPDILALSILLRAKVPRPLKSGYLIVKLIPCMAFVISVILGIFLKFLNETNGRRAMSLSCLFRRIFYIYGEADFFIGNFSRGHGFSLP